MLCFETASQNLFAKGLPRGWSLVWLRFGLKLALSVLSLHEGAVSGLPRGERAAALRGPVDGRVRRSASIKGGHVHAIWAHIGSMAMLSNKQHTNLMFYISYRLY